MDKKKKILVAISGGADSVALLHKLHTGGFVCEAAHCNFHLRGEESDRDEHFVRDLCTRLGVTLHVTHFDTKTYAAERGISIEMAARDLRYAWFNDLLASRGLDVVAVAHHADDAAETLLLNLTRGTGLRGLTGMKEVNGRVWRPMLSMSRMEVEDYCKANGLEFVTDSTNASDDYSRNKIRHHVVPALKSINPSVLGAMRTTTRHVSAVYDVFLSVVADFARRHVSESEDGCRIAIDGLSALADAEPYLFELLTDKGFSPSSFAQMADCVSAKRWGRLFYSDEWRAIVDREAIIVQRRDSISVTEGAVNIADTQCQLQSPIRLSLRMLAVANGFQFSRDPNVVHVDASRLVFPLSLRRWQQGDTMRPLGMKGSKKLSDLFTDCKLSVADKENIWVLENGDGKIIWVVGMRLDDRFKYRKECDRVLEMILEN